jgi:hypothetical protein
MKIITKLLVIVAVSCVFSISSYGQKGVKKLDRNYYVAGPTTEEVEFIEATPQCQNWAWAACAQILLNYHGLKVTQEQIIKKAYDDEEPCEEGIAPNIISAINGWSPASVERVGKVLSGSGTFNDQELVEHLSNGWPIIVSLESRSKGEQVFVIKSVYFSMDRLDYPKIDEVVLRNPWPLSPSEESMRWDLFRSKKPMFYDVWVE